jgi:uncharacterized protein (TIGR04222 family)
LSKIERYPVNWLMHNPIADMPGPSFLALYAATIVLIVVHAAVTIRRRDPTRGIEPPPVPSKPDPCEVAYLRGGENELTRLLIFELLHDSYLQQAPEGAETGHASGGPKIERAPDHPDPDRLDLLRRRVFDAFSEARSPRELFQPGGLAAQIGEQCRPLDWALAEEQLLSPAEWHRAVLPDRLAGTVLILALGGYRLLLALAKGRHNVGGLVLLAFVGLIVMAVASQVPRLTRRGQDYLARLRDAFGGLKARAAETATAGADPSILLVPAVFGVAALADTSYAYVPELFKAANSDGGGCGGACGGCGCGGCGCGCGCGG